MRNKFLSFSVEKRLGFFKKIREIMGLPLFAIEKDWWVVQTLTEFQMKYPDSWGSGAVSGFLADIYRHDGQRGDAFQEISKALELEPECPLIQKTANEIVDDFNNFLTGLTILYLVSLRIKCV